MLVLLTEVSQRPTWLTMLATGPVLDLPAITVAWGLAMWWSARWLSPTRGRAVPRDGSADGAPQEAVQPGCSQQGRGGHQGEQHEHR